MYGGALVKRSRIANKRTHKVRHRPNRPAYYTLKQSTINKYEKYFKNILPKFTKKSTIRKSTRPKREPKRFDPSVYNTRKTMNNRGTKSKGFATAAENNRMSAVRIPSAADERLVIVNKARELYGKSDATRNVRAAYIRACIRAKQRGETLSQALFSAQNEIAATMAAAAAAAASAASAAASASTAPASTAPASTAPASTAPASASADPAFAAADPAFGNDHDANSVEAMFAGLSI